MEEPVDVDEVRSVRFCGREWTVGYRGNQYKRQVQGNINSLMSMSCHVSYFAVSVTLYLFVCLYLDIARGVFLTIA